MNNEEIIIPVSSSDGRLPVYSSLHASGADLSARLDAPVVLAPGESRLIPTGLRMEIPQGYEGQVRPRSGLAAKWGITVLNSPGTIDSDYRGEIQIILINLGMEPYKIEPCDRIAQIVFSPVLRGRFVEQGSLRETSRGENGFGSTGS